MQHRLSAITGMHVPLGSENYRVSACSGSLAVHSSTTTILLPSPPLPSPISSSSPQCLNQLIRHSSLSPWTNQHIIPHQPLALLPTATFFHLTRTISFLQTAPLSLSPSRVPPGLLSISNFPSKPLINIP